MTKRIRRSCGCRLFHGEQGVAQAASDQTLLISNKACERNKAQLLLPKEFGQIRRDHHQ
jgi:hypothetical protein